MRLEVMYIMAHLVITLCLLLLYGVLAWKGHQDEILQSLLLIMGGYWFGAMGADKFKKPTTPTPEDKEGGQKNG